MTSTRLSGFAFLAVAALVPLSACGDDPEIAADCTVRLAPSGGDDTQAVQTALIEAQSGAVICFDNGTYKLTDEVSLTVPGVTLKGSSPGRKAVLDFAGQVGGAKSIAVTSDNFTVENLHVKNSPGDGIDVTGADHVTFRNVLVTWDAGSETGNGAYGIFPVQCSNVLIEDSEVVGASDAGIYVGQSNHVIVRRNKAHGNVAGIEFENTQFGEAYDNDVYDNTGGVLVFNLPDLPVKDGRKIRIYDNQIHDNNRDNFAKGGTIVASVPSGSGMIIMSADEVQVHGNTFSGNVSTAIAIAGYDTLPFPSPTDPMFDHFPERLYLHDNSYSMNGTMPKDILTLPKVSPLEDIVWDGRVDANKLPAADFKLCIKETGAGFRNIDDAGHYMNQSTDLAPHDCTYPALEPLPDHF